MQPYYLCLDHSSEIGRINKIERSHLGNKYLLENLVEAK